MHTIYTAVPIILLDITRKARSETVPRDVFMQVGTLVEKAIVVEFLGIKCSKRVFIYHGVSALLLCRSSFVIIYHVITFYLTYVTLRHSLGVQDFVNKALGLCDPSLLSVLTQLLTY